MRMRFDNGDLGEITTKHFVLDSKLLLYELKKCLQKHFYFKKNTKEYDTKDYHDTDGYGYRM